MQDLMNASTNEMKGAIAILEYNLIAEYLALLIIVAVLLSFLRDYETRTLRYKFLLYMNFAALISVVFTIVSTLISGPYRAYFSVPIIYLVNMIYFIILPVVTLFFLLYALAVTNLRNDERYLKRKILPACIPYFLYVCLVISNCFTNWIFTVSPEYGYIRGPLYQCTYLIVIANIGMVFYVAIKNINSIHRGTMQVMSVTLIIATVISSFQVFMPEILLSGFANVTSVLVVHLYIQNVRKSTDVLTGINNRMTLTHKLHVLAKNGDQFSLYVFSIRSFKSINERYGLEIGDKILHLVSEKLTEYMSYKDVFRYSGDEFAVVLKNVGEAEVAKIQKIVSTFDKAFCVDGYDVMIEMVYTRVDYKIFGSTVKELISAVDYSIRTLKERVNEGQFLYDRSIVKKMIEKNKMIQDLRSAIEEDRFEIHYQPIYSKNGYTQAEALIRMRNEQGTLIYPSDFIDLAESTGLISKITYIVLDKVCKNLKEILDNHQNECDLESISVNFPYIQFSQSEMVDDVMCILEKYEIPPSMIKIEMTERTLISDAKLTKRIMNDMNDMDFTFELDDFGTDYSNMHVFLDLPVEIIKIDRKFLLSVEESVGNKLFFEHLMKGIKATMRKVIVEGVETKEQFEFVTQCECEYIQGFYFSKPLPFSNFVEFLLDNKK